ncbi:hypothetical protein [Neorhodopirellula lusitana]|uniref:hypothetical protein n=1 Tax=Neorhodopirellula lusitana TaxID=445327 RepID=UPI00384CEAAA
MTRPIQSTVAILLCVYASVGQPVYSAEDADADQPAATTIQQPASAQESQPANSEPGSKPASTSDADLLSEMVTVGVVLTPQKRFVLPQPDFVSVTGTPVPTAQAKQILAKISGRHGDRFTRDSIVAPIAVNTDSIPDEAGNRIGHFIDVTFVVHQSIAAIRKSEAVDQFKTSADGTQSIEFAEDDGADDFEKNKSRTLAPAELEAFGVKLDDKSESLAHLQLALLGKVVIRGVARARRSVWPENADDSPIILTWILDDRFNSDAPTEDSVANQWRAIERTQVGEKQLGPPQPYAGLGGYVAITPVPEHPESSIVQIRFVLHEPKDWFSGRNLLRSKLPILVQDRVRNLRRELTAPPK